MKKQFGRFVLGICMMLFIAACAPLDMSTEELAARIQESMDSQINVHIVQEMHFGAPEGVDEMTEFGPSTTIQEQWVKDRDHSRMETRSESHPQHDSVFIHNGDQHWMYKAAENSYMTMDMKPMGSDEDAGEVEQPSAAEMIAEALENLDITYLGVEEVAGRAAYKLTASPKEDASAEFMMPGVGAMTMWVDQETFYPLQNEYDAGAGMIVSTKTTLVEFGVEMPDELFLPPSDAVEVERLPGMPEQMTIDEAEAAVAFDLLTLPEASGYDFETASVMSMAEMNQMAQAAGGEAPAIDEDGMNVFLVYGSGKTMVHIGQTDADMPGMTDMPEGVERPEGMPMPEPITIRGQEGHAMNMFGSVNLSWTENGIDINMGGMGLTLEELVALAESLE